MCGLCTAKCANDGLLGAGSFRGSCQLRLGSDASIDALPYFVVPFPAGPRCSSCIFHFWWQYLLCVWSSRVTATLPTSVAVLRRRTRRSARSPLTAWRLAKVLSWKIFCVPLDRKTAPPWMRPASQKTFPCPVPCVRDIPAGLTWVPSARAVILSAMGSVCVHPSDKNNCGGCHNQCSACGYNGVSYECHCLAGTTLCGASCKNLKTDKANCGACGKACASEQTCSFGVCVSDATATQATSSAT